MRDYDPDQPLIVIHIPKAAGTSSMQIFKAWFGDGFLRHYFDEVNGKMPQKYDLWQLHSRERPVVLHGHFNKLRNFGLEAYYPEASQFITILRDPFELVISHYFFVQKIGSTWQDQSRIPKSDLRNYLLNTKPNMLNHFPREVTLENYQEMIETQFIEVGITEYLSESLQRIAQKIGKPYEPESLKRLNTTERMQEVPYDLREEFMERNPLEFAVYHYALQKYIQTGIKQ